MRENQPNIDIGEKEDVGDVHSRNRRAIRSLRYHRQQSLISHKEVSSIQLEG